MEYHFDLIKETKDEGKFAKEINGSNIRQIQKPQSTRLKSNDDQLSIGYAIEIQRLAEAVRFISVRNSFQIIGITSALAGEGVSTLAAHIAYTTAQMEIPLQQTQEDVILVDTRIKHPSLHKQFDVQHSNSLLDIAGKSTLDLSIRKIRRSNMSLMTAKYCPKDANNGNVDLASLKGILEELKSRFGTIFLDIPPILESTEGLRLSALCEGVILVVRAHRTKQQQVLEAKRLLQDAGVNILGCHLNALKHFVPEWLHQRL